MLDSSRIKEQISLAYMRTIASAAHCVCEMEPKVDINSVDLQIIHSGRFAPTDRFKDQWLHVQMKATTRWEWNSGQCAFELPIKNYHDLREPTLTPSILVVFLMPDDHRQWVEHCEDSLLVRHCAYWHNLAGYPDVDNRKTCTVHLRKCNVFSPSALVEMMRRVARNEEWGDVL